MNLHKFQIESNTKSIDSTSPYHLVASPTGTGKSYMELDLLARLADAFIITPKIEIIRDMLCKLGNDAHLYSQDQVIDAGTRAGISTPMRVRNLMLAGNWTRPIQTLIWDEVHHHTAESWSLVDLMTGARNIGFTATPFRGTPKSSAKFREKWGEPHWAIRFPDAIRQNYLAMPTCRIQPLIDDDVISVGSNGEFETESLESEIMTRLDDAANFILGQFYAGEKSPIPTMVSVNTSKVAFALDSAIRNNLSDAKCCVVTQASPFDYRKYAFLECIQGRAILIQIDVVSEGVDLPQLRRLIDLRPTLSPVKWLQLFGRITRPGPVQPEYICCNRNLLRHGYLTEGCIPSESFVEAQNAFPPSARTSGMRAVGLEAIGRFKPTDVRMANGLNATLYNLVTTKGAVREEYAIILHPQLSEPLIAKKESTRDGDQMNWGKWRQLDTAITELLGFASAPKKTISEKQRAWWNRAASRYGLNADVIPDAKQFQILPVLSDIGKGLV